MKVSYSLDTLCTKSLLKAKYDINSDINNKGNNENNFPILFLFKKKKNKSIEESIDRNEYHPLIKYHYNIKIRNTFDVNWKKENQKRSGVILYNKLNDKIFFILGIDRKSNNLTDFGGGVKISKENPLEAGIREFNEETLNIFNTSYKEIKKSLCVYSNEMLIIFIKNKNYQLENTKYIEDFKKKLGNNKNHEIKSIIYISIDDFIKSLNGEFISNNGLVMYKLVRDLISPIFNDLVKKL